MKEKPDLSTLAIVKSLLAYTAAFLCVYVLLAPACDGRPVSDEPGLQLQAGLHLHSTPRVSEEELGALEWAKGLLDETVCPRCDRGPSQACIDDEGNELDGGDGQTSFPYHPERFREAGR